MRGAVEYKRKIGFQGQLLLEPKPQARPPRRDDAA
jgi:xylose isomerase